MEIIECLSEIRSPQLYIKKNISRIFPDLLISTENKTQLISVLGYTAITIPKRLICKMYKTIYCGLRTDAYNKYKPICF